MDQLKRKFQQGLNYILINHRSVTKNNLILQTIIAIIIVEQKILKILTRFY